MRPWSGAADDHTTLVLGRDGSTTFLVQPLEPVLTEHQQEIVRLLEQDRDRLDGEDGNASRISGVPNVLSVEPITPQTPPNGERKEALPIAGEILLTEAPVSDSQKPPRVRITGNLGREPRFMHTTRGVPKVVFLLAEHARGDDGEESTTWHTVYATKRFAEKIRDGNFRQGEGVKIEGVRHLRDVTDRCTGELKTEKQLYAYAVKRTKNGRTD